jgi:ribosome-binding protein aMBF1 (putative translation factor)
MSEPMKKRRTKRGIRIQVGEEKPRLFLVPKSRVEGVVRLIKSYEVEDVESVPWRTSVEDLIESHTEAGAALRGARVKESLSQTALAKKLGIPPSNISEMESGKRPIGKAMAKRLSAALNVGYRVFL